MASLVQDQDAMLVYGADQESSIGLSSEKVQGMANSIYSEFKRMMNIYGEDSIKELMPLIVTILESLDHSITECNENAVEVEMLKDDNEQLVTQYDRERQLRRTAEQQLIESEDLNEATSRELRSKTEVLENAARRLELKCKNYADQVERLQERESEIKKEYSILHERHTEMIQSYMEHIERTKILQQQQSYTDLSPSPQIKKDLPLVGSTPSPSESTNNKLFTPDSIKNTQTSELSQSEDQSNTSDSTNQSNRSLKDELPKSTAATPITDDALTKSFQQISTDMEVGLSAESDDGEWVSAEVKKMLENVDLDMEEKNTNEEGTDHDLGVESTGIENVAFDKAAASVNESSLFAELNEQDINDVDEGADILGMSKEVENLISENASLIATKNALNIVKDDLIQQIDYITSQHTLVKEELDVSNAAKSSLEEKVKDLEKQLARLRREYENAANASTSDDLMPKRQEEDETLPLSQRKRFTRVEMARVLMERNQYKERLMELQEAVRWTETLRASRAHAADIHQAKQKNKSTIFQFFSRLFTSSGNENTSSEPRQPLRRSLGSGDVGINMSYNVPTSKVIPRSRSAQISLYGRSPTIDTLREEPQAKPEPFKREVQPKMPDSRLQACGWSLPNTPGTPKEGSRTVPVPVYCAPLFENDDSELKLWCATSVDLTRGQTKDGGLVVGSASVFYDNVDDQKQTENEIFKAEGLSDLRKLDQEIKNKSNLIDSIEKKQNSSSSLVWIVAGRGKIGKSGTGSVVSVMDGCEPNRFLDQFSVGTNDTNILCIASVPGTETEDFNRELLCNPEMPDSVSREFATEATEELMAKHVVQKVQTKGVTEHVFADPDNIHPTTSKNSCPQLPTTKMKIGAVERVRSPSYDTVADMNRLASLQPTIWLGAQNGYVYVHSAVANWKKCLHQLRLKDSVLAIVHLKGTVLAGLADGTVAFFRRHNDGIWDLSNYHLLDLGRPHHSIRCMSVVYEHVWCAYRNKIHVVEPTTMKIQSSFDAHPRTESQVRQLAWSGDGVWISIRLDSTVRLYHARTLQHLQDVDVEPYVSKVLGSGKLGFSFVRITSLMISNHRLWIGTGNGVVMSVPISEGSKSTSSAPVLSSSVRDRPGGVIRVYSNPVSEKITPGTFIPYCSMANAQLSFHGFRDAVKFFVAVPGCVTSSSSNYIPVSPPKAPYNTRKGTLLLSGGGGYVDFRKGDLGAVSPEEKKIESMKVSQGTMQKSHLIVWQLTHSSVL